MSSHNPSISETPSLALTSDVWHALNSTYRHGDLNKHVKECKASTYCEPQLCELLEIAREQCFLKCIWNVFTHFYIQWDAENEAVDPNWETIGLKYGTN